MQQYANEENRPPEVRLELPQPTIGLSFEEQLVEIHKVAKQAFGMTSSWVVFYREILGPDGFVARSFSTRMERERFDLTSAHGSLLQMLTDLRETDTSKVSKEEPERMITLRVPSSVHSQLVSESNALNLSVNKLCLSKILMPIDGKYVPKCEGRRRGRAPGPQLPKKTTPKEEDHVEGYGKVADQMQDENP